MNSLSTHDTERAITVMAGEPLDGKDREWQADTKLDDEHKKLGVKLLKVASAMQFTLPDFRVFITVTRQEWRDIVIRSTVAVIRGAKEIRNLLNGTKSLPMSEKAVRHCGTVIL